MIKIAFLQLLPCESMKETMEKGIRYCREAKEQGADIALFPELWNCGYRIPHDMEQLNALAVSADGEFAARYGELAKELELAVGITFLESGQFRPKNTICLYDRHGKAVYKYSKVHICDFGETDDESVLCAGDEFVAAELETAKGNLKVGSMICYDREFPESARILMLKGAELVLVPNACPMEVNRLSQLRGRAYENMLAIATCNYPAPHLGCNGHSTLFDGVIYQPERSEPRDTCVLETDESEGLFFGELDIHMLREFRKREYQNLKNRRPELYGILAEPQPEVAESLTEFSGDDSDSACNSHLFTGARL